MVGDPLYYFLKNPFFKNAFNIINDCCKDVYKRAFIDEASLTPMCYKFIFSWQ